jgi:hypothetical protein
MAQSSHKPYRYTAGAYSAPPQLRAHQGRWHARGAIEQWKASLGDVRAAAEVVLDGPGDRDATVTVTLTTGTATTYESVDAFSGALEALAPDSVLTVRVDAKAGPDGDAVILLRCPPSLSRCQAPTERRYLDSLS